MPNYVPRHLARWTASPNYVGKDWRDWYIAPLAEWRGCGDRAHFAFNRQVRSIPAAQFHTEDGAASPCIVTDNHWSLGWVRWYAIHKDDTVALRKANAFARRQMRARDEGED